MENKDEIRERAPVRKIKRKVIITIGVVLAAYALLLIVRVPHALEKLATEEAVADIHATRLTLADVMGDNLPPDPGPEADKTIEGIDANNNGIRDDVELAIFREYPNSPKIRAALLQYALALQMEASRANTTGNVVTSVAEMNSRADYCVSELVPRLNPESVRTSNDIEKIDSFINFVRKLQLNTPERLENEKIFYENLGSYSLGTGCDIDLQSFED